MPKTFDECIDAIEDYADCVAEYGREGSAHSPERGPAAAARANLADAHECRARARRLFNSPRATEAEKELLRFVLGEDGSE